MDPQLSTLSQQFQRLEARLGAVEKLLHPEPGTAEPVPLIKLIQIKICHEFGVSMNTLLSRCRLQHIADARHLGMFLAIETTGLPHHAIARAFRRERSDISHARKAVLTRIDTEPVFAATVAGWLAHFKQQQKHIPL